MRIGELDLDERVLVVAEIGNNHEGDPAIARDLVRAAADAGADAVKLQTFRTPLFVRPSDRDRYERLSRFELPPETVEELERLARSLGLIFLSTPLDLESVAFLEPLVDAYKVASGDNDFWPLLEAVAATGKPTILSTGLSELAQVERAAALFGRDGLAVLQCTSAYPAPPEEANLAAIRLLADRLGCTAGYSDHTLGIEAAVAAVAAGARILEKHLTLDKERSDFRDHRLSADPPELRALVRRVREVEILLGRPEKTLQPSEAALAVAARRSIAAAADLPEGHRLTVHDLTWLRPADGLPPGEEGRLLGRDLRRPVERGEPIRPEDVG
jgi:N,N'-diacetyllegionaminate synthase